MPSIRLMVRHISHAHAYSMNTLDAMPAWFDTFSARQRRQKSCHAMTSGLKRTSEVHSERRVIYRCDATMCNSLSKIY